MVKYQIQMHKQGQNRVLEFNLEAESAETINFLISEFEQLGYHIGGGEDLSPPELQGQI